MPVEPAPVGKCPRTGNSPARIAVAGAGLIGKRHIARVQEDPDCLLVAIVDPAPATEAIAEQLGVPWFQSLEQLIEACRPDGVVLATPNHLHVAQCLECIAAEVAVLVEKPVAHTLEEGERLMEVAEVHNAIPRILVGHHRAHSPIMSLAQRVIQEGTIGRVVAVMGSALFYKPDDYFDAAPWRRQAGGGPILINMIHEVHNMRMLCGEIVEVQAFASNATRSHVVEDTVAINFRFASGALGTFMLSDTAATAKSWEQTSQEDKSYAAYPDEDCYVICGTHGSLSVPTMRLKTYDRTEDRSWWKPFTLGQVDLQREDPLKIQMSHFASMIQEGAKPIVSVRDGVQNLRVTDAIVEAARTGRAAPVRTGPEVGSLEEVAGR